MTDEDLQMTDEEQAMLYEEPDHRSDEIPVDGLAEIYIGTLFLAIGGGALLGVSMTFIWIFMIAFGVLVATRIKENVTYPRFGRPKTRVIYSKVLRDFIFLFFAIIVIFGVGVLGLGVSNPDILTGVSDNIALVGGIIVAIIYGVLGFRWKIKQYYLFAVVGLIAGVLMRVIFPLAETQLLVFIAVLGITMLGTGVMMLQQFQQEYPIRD